MTLLNIRRFIVMRATLRGREVEFVWSDGNGRRLGQPALTARPQIVDVLSRQPLDVELTDEEQERLQDAIVAP